jgi:hypothetical protein
LKNDRTLLRVSDMDLCGITIQLPVLENQSPAVHAGDWFSKTTHRKRRKEEAGSAKGSLVLSYCAQSGVTHLVEFTSGLFNRGNLQAFGRSPPFSKALPRWGPAAFLPCLIS